MKYSAIIVYFVKETLILSIKNLNSLTDLFLAKIKLE